MLGDLVWWLFERLGRLFAEGFVQLVGYLFEGGRGNLFAAVRDEADLDCPVAEREFALGTLLAGRCVSKRMATELCARRKKESCAETADMCTEGCTAQR